MKYYKPMIFQNPACKYFLNIYIIKCTINNRHN
ncbi:hypothetical protein PS838_03639 [Pseudomonas fluorescens]|nr:hypothetical protein PS838_03639 [Pseudomonas fluorescens]